MTPRKYTGPARPLPTTHHDSHPPTGTISRILVLSFLIATLLLDLFVWRAG